MFLALNCCAMFSNAGSKGAGQCIKVCSWDMMLNSSCSLFVCKMYMVKIFSYMSNITTFECDYFLGYSFEYIQIFEN